MRLTAMLCKAVAHHLDKGDMVWMRVQDLPVYAYYPFFVVPKDELLAYGMRANGALDHLTLTDISHISNWEMECKLVQVIAPPEPSVVVGTADPMTPDDFTSLLGKHYKPQNTVMQLLKTPLKKVPFGKALKLKLPLDAKILDVPDVGDQDEYVNTMNGPLKLKKVMGGWSPGEAWDGEDPVWGSMDPGKD